MHLLRPYPDELLGSLLSRAMRQLGLSQKRLMKHLTGRNITTISRVITGHEGIARAFGMDLEEFIHSHTLLPYAVAFMAPRDKGRILTSLFSGRSDLCVSAVAQNATKSTSLLKLCVACKAQDLLQYGETYWRRSHQLPGVLLCAVHEQPLRLSDVDIRAKRFMLPPNEVQSVRACAYEVSRVVLMDIARFSDQALRLGLSYGDWAERYRDLAASHGYSFTSGQIFGEVLSADLRSFYGDAYLSSLGANIDLARRNAWPALLVRSSGASTTALKHVLLNIFLLNAQSPSRSPSEYERRKKAKPRDWDLIQRKAIAVMDKEVARCKREGRRITVRELAQKAGIVSLLHHFRHEIPTILLWIERFKATSQSERQAGKRPRTYPKKR